MVKTYPNDRLKIEYTIDEQDEDGRSRFVLEPKSTNLKRKKEGFVLLIKGITKLKRSAEQIDVNESDIMCAVVIKYSGDRKLDNRAADKLLSEFNIKSWRKKNNFEWHHDRCW